MLITELLPTAHLAVAAVDGGGYLVTVTDSGATLYQLTFSFDDNGVVQFGAEEGPWVQKLAEDPNFEHRLEAVLTEAAYSVLTH